MNNIQTRRLHGFECYRDVYFKLGEQDVLTRFGATNVADLFNGVYTKHIEEEGAVFKSTAEMKSEGYFYVPPQTIQGEIVVKRDFNLIDEFEITLISNFLQAKELKILEYSTGAERYNSEVPGSRIIDTKSFGKSTVPYYPLMDTSLLGNLWVKAELGYINNPDQKMVINGICTGLLPTFRPDGLPVVTFTFRDIGWSMGKHVLSATYPSLRKDPKLDEVNVIGEIKKHG